MPMTHLGRACVLADHIHGETTRAEPDWRQIAADSGELQRIAQALVEPGKLLHDDQKPTGPAAARQG